MDAGIVSHRIEHGMFVRERAPLRPPGRGVVVFVHGLGESGLCFEHLLRPDVLPERRLLVPDLPGYGRSAWPALPSSLAAQADLVATWLEAVAPQERPRTIVGHSMGGVIAVLLAERHPGCADLCVNVDGNVSLGDCVFSGRAAESSLEDFVGGGFDRLRETVRRQGSTELAQRGYYVGMRLADPRQFHRNGLELVEISAREDMPARMRASTTPVHYVAGVPRGACARSRELLDRDGVAWSAIEESGHWPFVDQPEAFVALLAALAP